jgi:hypothetical protein
MTTAWMVKMMPEDFNPTEWITTKETAEPTATRESSQL